MLSYDDLKLLEYSNQLNIVGFFIKVWYHEVRDLEWQYSYMAKSDYVHLKGT